MNVASTKYTAPWYYFWAAFACRHWGTDMHFIASSCIGRGHECCPVKIVFLLSANSINRCFTNGEGNICNEFQFHHPDTHCAGHRLPGFAPVRRGAMGVWGFNYGNNAQQLMYKRELASAIALSHADIYNARGFLAI
ncbi:hypothetical protein [Herbaspirillum rubrisubalbicans]|uniref:hypothetical protein n=1 Tax=Herbaspirillum rubrisubalbicans TaxID=80842 RepID=UPI001EEA4DFA|nr:hypothetical protein [Herbaspirillum rubrisubalbicans]